MKKMGGGVIDSSKQYSPLNSDSEKDHRGAQSDWDDELAE